MGYECCSKFHGSLKNKIVSLPPKFAIANGFVIGSIPRLIVIVTNSIDGQELKAKVDEEDLSDEFNLTASAPLAGPYDLKGTIDSIFLAGDYSSSAYAGYFITAYNELYNWNRLYDIFQSPWAGMMYGLFNGTKSWGEINDALPENFSALMKPSFIAAYNSGLEPEFKAALAENTLLDWIPQSPIHFFHGDEDDIVPIHNALTAFDKFTQNGAQQIMLTIIPGGNHETSGPSAIFGALEWFEGFRTDA